MAKIKQEEKRRETIERQLYGKQTMAETNTRTFSYKLDNTSTPLKSEVTDTSYLKKDLIKVFLFSFLAIGLQLALFWGLNQGMKVPFLSL